MRKVLFVFITTLLLAGRALAFDAELAARLQSFYRPFDSKACAKALHMIPPKDFVAAVKAGEPLYVVDVRTPAESGIYGIHLADGTAAPLNQLFRKETLERLPTDRRIVLVCKGGHRATAGAMGLRQIGFDNVYVLKGGLAALAAYLTPKSAY
jgi:rhodanese-related sulfurtransferase